MRWPWQKDEKRYSLDEVITWLNSFTYNGNTYTVPQVHQTLTGEAEPTPDTFADIATQAWGGNAVVFACEAVRLHVFSSVRFQWQMINGGRPGDLFGNPGLRPLEAPWDGGTTQDLLARMILDADLAGNFYAIRDTPLARIGGDTSTFEIVRLRPDWVSHVRQSRIIKGGQVGWRRLGIVYYEGGRGTGAEGVTFPPGEFAQFAPLPDPLANWRGMSWCTPIVRELRADGQMTTHKLKYFENGATPSMVVRYPPDAKEQDMKAVQKLIEGRHTGVDNAFKTIHIGGGADVTLVGANMDQVSFKELQGAGESRIAAAAGTPPAIVGLSEGLQGSALSSGNYSAARRRLADGTAHPLWGNAAGSLEPLIATESALGNAWNQYRAGGIRLWYDGRDVPFLREDKADEAEIRGTDAQSIRTLTDAGFTADSSVRAITTGDLSLLVHSGLFSVQLQLPGTTAPPDNTNGNGGNDGNSAA